MEKLKQKIEKQGPLRSILSGIICCLIYLGVRYLFNLVLLPKLFPEAGELSTFHLSTLASLLLALCCWLGFPYFSFFTLFGLILSNTLTAHYSLLEGNSFPSLMANVYTTASQGGGFLIGAASEYTIWLARRIQALRITEKKSPSPSNQPAEDALNDNFEAS